MKCKNCGNEVSGKEIFCPKCSALLSGGHSGRLSELLNKIKAFVSDKDIVSVMCLGEIILSIIFISACFCKSFVIAGSNIYVQLSLYDTFVANRRFNFVLIIIFNILTDAVLFSVVLKKAAVRRIKLLIPAATYVWSIIQFAIKVSSVSETAASSNGLVSFEVTPIGWIIPIVCAVSIILLVLIVFKLKSNKSK